MRLTWTLEPADMRDFGYLHVRRSPAGRRRRLIAIGAFSGLIGLLMLFQLVVTGRPPVVPLLIALPLGFVFFRYVAPRVTAANLKSMASRPDSGFVGPHVLELQESGLWLEAPSARGRLEYSGVTSMVEDDNVFAIYLGRRIVVVPTRAFPNADARRAFIIELERRTGHAVAR